MTNEPGNTSSTEPARACSICGKTEYVEVHQIRKEIYAWSCMNPEHVKLNELVGGIIFKVGSLKEKGTDHGEFKKD